MPQTLLANLDNHLTPLLKNYSVMICEITMQASEDSVDSKFLKL